MVNTFPFFLRIQEIFSSLTEHVELTFKVSPLPIHPPLPWGQGWGVTAVQVDKYSMDGCISQVTAFILRSNYYQK